MAAVLKDTPVSVPPQISALARALVRLHKCLTYSIEETHISWVILTEDHAYKIKKPVYFEFLDFRTLEQRKYFCEQELHLNRRFSPELYLDVVAFSGDKNNATISSAYSAELTSKTVFEYAVKMQRFNSEQRCDRQVQQHKFTAAMVDTLATTIGQQHSLLPVCAQDSAWGEIATIQQPVMSNFDLLSDVKNSRESSDLKQLVDWSQTEIQRLTPLFLKRKQQGFIRECHGDLHLGNIVWHRDKPMLFDCLEFNESFRKVDTMSDIAFTIMDFTDHKHADLASRFLNRYLQTTGDYEGVGVLRFYLVYRALVRAKVNWLASNPAANQAQTFAQLEQCFNYVHLAKQYSVTRNPRLILMHGVSGSGKSVIADYLCAPLNAIVVRSDLERKRLAGLPLSAGSGSEPGGGIYTSEATEKLYSQLLRITDLVLDAGFTIIIDASFLNMQYRNWFRDLANRKQIQYSILSIQAPIAALHERIELRTKRAVDASEASLDVLRMQLRHQAPLHANELINTLIVDTSVQNHLTLLFKALDGSE